MLKGIILKKIILTIWKEQRSSKREDCKLDFGRCSMNKEHANKKYDTPGLWSKTLAKWLLEFLGIPRNFFLGIPRNKGVNFHRKFGLGIPRNSQT